MTKRVNTIVTNVGASDEIVLRRDAEGAIELWLNGCLVYAD